jgi:hypothetical protein
MSLSLRQRTICDRYMLLSGEDGLTVVDSLWLLRSSMVDKGSSIVPPLNSSISDSRMACRWRNHGKRSYGRDRDHAKAVGQAFRPEPCCLPHNRYIRPLVGV